MGALLDGLRRGAAPARPGRGHAGRRAGDRAPARPARGWSAADFAREMLRVGRRKLAGRRAAASRPTPPTATTCPTRDGAFDGAFSGFCVRNLRDLPVALAELRRVVRPGGPLVILEFFRPAAAAAVLRSLLQRPRPAAARLGGHRRPRGLPLPARVDRALPSAAPSSRTLLRAAGFAEVDGAGPVPVGRGLAGGGAMKLVVAVGGASGSIYAKRLLDALAAAGRPSRSRSGWCFSQLGQRGLAARARRRARLPLPALRRCATSARRSPRARRAGTRWW